MLVIMHFAFSCFVSDQHKYSTMQSIIFCPVRPGRTQSHPISSKFSCRGRRPSAMDGSVDRQVRRESLEHELRNVRSVIRTLCEAAETAQDQSVTFQLECAEEKEVQLLEAVAELDADPD